MNEGAKNLTVKDLTLILNNCYANIFVTDGEANVIFVNRDAAEVLCSTEEYLLSKNSRELIEEGVIDWSTTLNSLKTKERTVGTFKNKDGHEIISVTTPVFDKQNNLQMCVTYSRTRTDMDVILDELKKERIRSNRFKDAVTYFDKNKKATNDIIYRSDIMEELCRTAQIIAPTDSTVMLYGESGVGKEVVSNYIHNHSLRKDEIFVPINCAAIPKELLESELFGYEKGGFTGAGNKGKAGLFEIANNGTIFLDEIGELPLDMQSKLLRVLESGEFRRVGSNEVKRSDVRIIGATNRDLMQMVKDKTFREDLYYRLNVLPIHVPALRERKEDVDELTQYFIEKYNKKYAKNFVLTDAQKERLRLYSWPGNVRELRNIIERYVITGNENVIFNLKYEEEQDAGAVPYIESHIHDEHGKILPLKEKMNELEQEYIKAVLAANENNVQKTAEQLQVHRSLIYRKVKVK